MKGLARLALAAIVATLAAAPATSLAAGRAKGAGPRIGADGAYEVRAEFTGSTGYYQPGGGQGKATYKERSRGSMLEQRFSLELEHATPGTSLPVAVNGIPFATLVADELGRAELELRNLTDDPGVGPLPPGFPRIHPGDVLTVGGLTGSFVAH